jgi:hypothetical protein
MTFSPNGKTLLKRRILEKLGYIIVEIPYFVWDNIPKVQHKTSLKKIIQEISKISG